MPTVDLSNVQATDFDALPSGTYRVAVDRPPEIRTSANGNEGAFWLLRVVDVINVRGYEGDGVGLVNRTIAHGTSFVEKALFNLKRTLAAFGASEEELNNPALDIDEEYLSQFEGKEAVVRVTQREYQGQMQNNVQSIRALTEQEAGALA
jgi:hypothetical protein